MRIFDLFLRRAGVERADLASARRSVSRLTVECSESMLGGLRKQICVDFKAAGLNVSQVDVQRAGNGRLASACVTVDCPADKRAELMAQARRIGVHPGVHSVRFASRADRRAAAAGAA